MFTIELEKLKKKIKKCFSLLKKAFRCGVCSINPDPSSVNAAPEQLTVATSVS